MPRNSQGLYTLPPGNPVTPGTLIEAQWANETMSDLATAMTDSLPTDGSVPMTGPLTLESALPTQARHAVSKAYLDNFVALSTGLPVGAIIQVPFNSVPTGFLLCNGQSVSRATYSVLFGLIGTNYGSGDGINTFNLPNIEGQFVRGRGGSRILGSTQAAMVGPHTHPLDDPGHTHLVSPLVNSQQAAITTPGPKTAVFTDPGAPVTIASATTGVTAEVNSGTENVPQNIAFDFYIKALQDSSGPTAILNIDTNDPQAISIDNTILTAPVLDIHTNIPFGLLKLDANAKVPIENSQSGVQSFLGVWDASTGLNPSEAFPLTNYISGNTFIIGVSGIINVFDPATDLSSPTAVSEGDQIIYVKDSPGQPDGWYHVVSVVLVTAASVSFIPSGGISAVEVQSAIEELDLEKAPFSATTAVGTSYVPGGGISATNVQTAIAELDVEKAPFSATTAIGTGFTPSGDISATNVQAAIVELDTEKLPKAGGTMTGDLEMGSGTKINFEGATVDTFETSLTVVDPTADRTITFADESGTVATLENNTFGFRNRIINGNMRIDQRFNGVAQIPVGASYTVDRWRFASSQGSKFQFGQNLGAVAPPVGFSNYLGLRTAVAVALVAGDVFFIEQFIEGFNVADLEYGTVNAKTITVSFWAYSSQIGTFSGSLANSASTRTYVFNFSIPVANTWTRITATIPGDTTGVWLKDNGIGLTLIFSLGAGATYHTTPGSWQAGLAVTTASSVHIVSTLNATFYFTGVQLEEGKVASKFEIRDYGRQISLCQRYYTKLASVNGNFVGFGVGASISATTSNIVISLPTALRAAPTVTFSNVGVGYGAGLIQPITAVNTVYSGNNSILATVTNNAGPTVGNVVTAQGNNSSIAYVDFSAEL